MNSEQRSWLGRLGNLNTAITKRRGIAPHKPLLLLAVLEMADAGHINAGEVAYDVEVTHRFRALWPIVLDRQQNAPDVRMPFFALGGARDDIWTPLDADGRRAQGKLAVKRARLPESLVALLADARFRHRARQLLISTYFMPKERIALFSRYGLNVPASDELEGIARDSEEYRTSRKVGRSARFKIDVVCGYQYRCALTGYRLVTEDSHLVQAAHIHQHAKGGADVAENGLALSPTAHWMFDQGLWTVDDSLRVVVASRLFADDPVEIGLEQFSGRQLQFDSQSRLRPRSVHFQWHREHVFRGV